MEWLQEFSRQVTNFNWWQISLLVVAVILISIFIGLSISYIVINFVHKNRVTFLSLFYLLFSKKRKSFSPSDLARQPTATAIASPESNEPTPELEQEEIKLEPEPAREPEQEEIKLEPEPTPELEQEEIKLEPEPTPEPKQEEIKLEPEPAPEPKQEEIKLEPEPAKSPIPELFVEIENNLKILTEFSGDILLPLQSNVWDALGDSVLKLPDNLREQLEQVYSDIKTLKGFTWLATDMGHRSSLIDELYRKKVTTITEELKRIKQDIK